MSCTEIYMFNKEGNAELYDDVYNAWRGAMAIWTILNQKYLHKRFNLSMEFIERVWKLADDPNTSIADKIVLLTTFDRYVIKKEDIPTVIECFRHDDYEDTSLSEQAEILQSLYDNDDCIAVGWNQNDINCNNWGTYHKGKPYNIFKGKEHHYVFDEIPCVQS